MFSKSIPSLAALVLLAACSSAPSAKFSDADARRIDGYTVKWSDASALVGKRSDGLETLMFIVAPSQQGLSPASQDEKLRLAQTALSGARCKWERFDPAVNEGLIAMNGGREYILYALARC